ncbi:MAG: phosphocholine cytidylyltransferase family protein [Ignavibacteriales bacterium]|nr:phosphocholine cytidylyltransferase family protein [Ignavibacteriales bacterium]
MQAVILAAGVAFRLRPLTNKTPKCLLKLAGKTILERTISNLLFNGINDFVIVTGYLQEQIKYFINSQFPSLNVKYIFNEKYEVTNNIYSLWLTKSEVGGKEFILLDSDIIFDKAIVSLITESNYQNVLALRSDDHLSEEEIKISLNSDGSIKEIGKVVSLEDAIGESIGIEKFSDLFSKKLFQLLDKIILQENQTNIFYEAAFQRLIDSSEKIFTEDVGELKCIELDTPEDLQKAEREIIFYLQ